MPTRTIRLQSPNDNANVIGIALVPVDTPSEHEGLRCDVRLYPKLKTLHCASMRLTGLTGYDVLTELEEVKCQDNQLAGGLWPLLENIKLKHFWCHSNFLGGSIPDITQPAFYGNNEPDVSLSMDGAASRIIVGTRQLASGGGDRSIKVYDWNGTGWELSATVTHGTTNSNNGFNPKLSRDGQTMTFGAPNTKTSAVYTTTTFD
jgi:hypothetical protein